MAPSSLPNILMIVLDTTRVDRLSAYGYERPTTPDPCARRHKGAAIINGTFLGWLDRRGDEPFFAFINYMEPHAFYEPPSPSASSSFAGRRRRGAGAVMSRSIGTTPVS